MSDGSIQTGYPVLPRGACDAHCHIFGPFDRFPLPEDRSFTPPEAPETALRRLHARLGFDHAVTTESRWLRRRGEDLTAPRLHPRDVDGPTFDEWLRIWT